MRLLIAFLVALVAMNAPVPATAQTVLWMAEEPGCVWCARWRAEIGPIYPKTAEGKTAPLRRYDLHSQSPRIELTRDVHFTPTFLLVQNGREVGRIEGYPGEDFFWGLLDVMFERANIPLAEAG